MKKAIPLAKLQSYFCFDLNKQVLVNLSLHWGINNITKNIIRFFKINFLIHKL